MWTFLLSYDTVTLKKVIFMINMYIKRERFSPPIWILMCIINCFFHSQLVYYVPQMYVFCFFHIHVCPCSYHTVKRLSFLVELYGLFAKYLNFLLIFLIDLWVPWVICLWCGFQYFSCQNSTACCTQRDTQFSEE